jgi:hypothetical protein
MELSACRSLAGISLQIVSKIDPQGFVHVHLDGLRLRSETMLDAKETDPSQLLQADRMLQFRSRTFAAITKSHSTGKR